MELFKIINKVIKVSYRLDLPLKIKIYLVSQYVPTRYKVLCMIDERCRVRIYVGGEAVYIYTSLRGQVCARVIATPSHNNAPGQCRDTLRLINLKFPLMSTLYLRNLPDSTDLIILLNFTKI